MIIKTNKNNLINKFCELKKKFPELNTMKWFTNCDSIEEAEIAYISKDSRFKELGKDFVVLLKSCPLEDARIIINKLECEVLKEVLNLIKEKIKNGEKFHIYNPKKKKEGE